MALRSSLRSVLLLAAAPLLMSAGPGFSPKLISQRGLMFHPGHLTLQRGDTIEIVNDDDELIHHAYVASPDFSFDTLDQAPGSKTDILFSVAGSFTVRCGIHPRMRLDVTVEN